MNRDNANAIASEIAFEHKRSIHQQRRFRYRFRRMAGILVLSGLIGLSGLLFGLELLWWFRR